MHYARNAFSVDPASNTIVPLPAYSQFLNVMGQQFDPVLSASDRAGMIQVYGAGPGATNIVTNTLDSGPGSLRAALYYAYDHPGTTISFNIPVSDPGYSNNVFNILPSDDLTSLWGNTMLDGTTEPTNSNPAGPEILLNGALCHTISVYPNGLKFQGTNSLARGLVINNFPKFGVLMDGSNTVGNTVSGCYLGVDPTGTIAVTNGVCPVQISGGAISNVVGGTTAAARNIIGGSVYQGLVIRDAGTKFNTVQGNYIGLNAAGTAALPNTWSGVEIFGGAQSNLIGGYSATAGNVISGNLLQGILISDAATSNNIVAGNYIGLGSAGTNAIPNGDSGVEIGNSSRFNFIGNSNVISGNANYGVLINSTANNRVVGNFIGLDAAGTNAVPNGFGGVDFYFGAQNNSAISNVISGNTQDGVLFYETGVSSNVVQGNLIGLNAAGTAAVPNGWSGVDFYFGAQNNLVGGNTPAARNVISGNGNRGVIFAGATTTGNAVAGNYIGLNAAGSAAVSNTWSGVEISSSAAFNVIGGYGDARNFISGNGNYGISINNGGTANVIQGNTIGLNGTSGAAIPNAFDGIVCFAGAPGNQIGGTAPGAANLIAANKSYGVEINDAASTNNTIRGNSIFSNNFGGITLDGAGNHNLAAPALTSAVVTTNTVVSGSYSGASGNIYLLDFYADAPPAASAEAMTYLGTISVTGTGGSAAFNAKLGVRLPAGRALTATATDPAGNTSQLSTGVAATMTSSVNDGIPNAWRALYFGGSGTTTNSQSAAFADPDHDGLSNYQEFLAGTNPTNAASAFLLTAQNPLATPNVVSLNSANGTIYRILFADSLTAASWNILADQIVGTGTNIFFTDPAAASLPKRFYRAEVLW
jgi:parallel beta-helix repeat protein